MVLILLEDVVGGHRRLDQGILDVLFVIESWFLEAFTIAQTLVHLKIDGLLLMLRV